MDVLSGGEKQRMAVSSRNRMIHVSLLSYLVYSLFVYMV